MSRRIETGVPPSELSVAAAGVAAVASTAQTPTQDDYLGRLLKYIPAEIIGFYLAAAGIVSPTEAAPNITGLWVVFALGFALVPIYFFIVTKREGKKPLWSQIILASLAYPVWTFAIGGPFKSLEWYSGAVASLVLIFTTVVFGIYKPEAGS